MPYAIVMPRMAAIRTDASGQPMCRSSCIARCLIGCIEDVALARVNLARDAGDEHLASLKAHRAFERRNKIVVVDFLRLRVALVDRKSVVEGKSVSVRVDLGGGSMYK